MPALGGNGLAMRTSMFSHAAEKTGDVLIIAVEPGAAMAGEIQLFRNDTMVTSISEGLDTRLQLIARAQPASSRPGLLVEYGKPLASMALSAAAITRILEHLAAFEPDIIIMSRSYLLPLADAFGGALAKLPLLVDLDDDDGALCRSLATCERAAGRDNEALWLEAQADVCDAVISRHAGAVRLFTTASTTVARSIQQRLAIPKISWVPNGISSGGATHATKQWSATDKTTLAPHPGPVLIFVGNLSYGPNVDGMSWFLDEVWTGLRKSVAGLNLMVAGSDPDKRLTSLCQQEGVQLIVSPPDLKPLYELADAAIVPLRFGSGSRIKILEAGVHDVPVVSTFAGAEGLDLQPEMHAFLSDETADAFVNACLECLRNRDEARCRSIALQAFIQEHHDRQKIVAELHRTLRKFTAG